MTALIETLLGTSAAFCTTVSYVPQVIKVWKTGETHDLSSRMLMLLAAGLSLWIGYGFVRADPVIVAANALSASLVAVVLYFKMRQS